MKKKIKIPKGFKFKSQDNMINSNNPYLIVNLEKKQKPELLEWIKVTSRRIDTTLNKIYKVKEWHNNHIAIIDDVGDRNEISNSKWQPATPAEIEAHELGFHVGDEVYIKNGPACYEIKDFLLGKEKITALTKNGLYFFLDNLTKTPPKTPIFQIDGKDMFHKDEYYLIDSDWKLKKIHVPMHKDELPGGWIQRFLTEQEATNFVLEEAKSRFEGCSAKSIPDNSKILKIDKIYLDDCRVAIASGILEYLIWMPYNGWLAEPIKQPKLMLGDWEAFIREDNATIRASNGEVTKKEWLAWYDFIKVAREMSCGLSIISGNLGGYKGTYLKKENKYKLGCIENVTFEQIEAITNELKKLQHDKSHILATK